MTNFQALVCHMLVASSLGFSAQAVSASCAGIGEPPAGADLEDVKYLIVDGRIDDAFATFAIDKERKRSLVTSVKALLPGKIKRCITVKRYRPSSVFVSEVFMTESDDGIPWWSFFGVTHGSKFEMMNFSVDTDFAAGRELLY